MNVICSICSDQLIQSDDIFYTRCGHVFHLQCLTPWLDRSKSCPQCREKVTQSKIHKLHFTYSSSDIIEPRDSTLQEKVDSLKFQILLKEKDIHYYTSKSITLEKQNAGLRQEVYKVESEVNKKNAAIHALKEQIDYFKKKSSHCDDLKTEIAKLKSELEDLEPIQVLLYAPINSVTKMVKNTKDPETLTRYISILKKKLLGSFNKCKELRMTINRLQEELNKATTKPDSLLEEQSRRMDLEEQLAFSESKCMALQKRVDELEEILGINEENSNLSEVQKVESKSSISKKSPVQTKVKGEKTQETLSKNHVFPKRKTDKTSVSNGKNESNCNKKYALHSQEENVSSDSEIEFINCSSSENSPSASKRLKILNDNMNISNKSDNNFKSNPMSKKQRKYHKTTKPENVTRKKTSDIEDKRDTRAIDLT